MGLQSWNDWATNTFTFTKPKVSSGLRDMLGMVLVVFPGLAVKISYTFSYYHYIALPYLFLFHFLKIHSFLIKTLSWSALEWRVLVFEWLCELLLFCLYQINLSEFQRMPFTILFWRKILLSFLCWPWYHWFLIFLPSLHYSRLRHFCLCDSVPTPIFSLSYWFLREHLPL